MINKTLQTLSLLLSIAICAACSPEAIDETPDIESSAAAEQPVPLGTWLDQRFEEELQFFPTWLTFLGRKERNDELNDVSYEAFIEYLNWKKTTVDEMRERYDYDALTDAEKTSYDVWVYQYEENKAAKEFFFNRRRFTQQNGLHSNLPTFLINFHAVDELQDMEAYIARIRATPSLLTEELENASAVSAGGTTSPDYALQATIDQSRAVITGAPFQSNLPATEDAGDSSLWADIKAEVNKLKESAQITEEQADKLLTEARQALVIDLQPAYERVTSWAETELDKKADSGGALVHQPNGENYYRYRLASQTTTDLSADEIHQVGLEEVERIRGEMALILDEIKFDGSLDDFFVHLRESPDNYYPDNDEGRQAYIDRATEIINHMETQIPNYFGIVPKAGLIVKRVEPYRERDGAAQHYYPGTPDGSRPGIYYAHLSDMNAMPKSDLQTIAYHEGIPGHHMQVSIAQELTDVPKFRGQAFFTAYTEGWALYSELLATEIPGAYWDPYSRFGQLNNELWRAVRLVVDTGLHAKGWTEQEAIDYFSQNSSSSLATVISEVRRYVVMPAQATTYKIGMLKILELRNRAKAALGDKFDIREFHDVILGGGALPLSILERKVDNWIAARNT